ncbi:Ubiquitin-like-specific protease 1D [Euphorbia peplus]|nr:Ubiquitin-like-specific protease 1D [Euphorbia peplus]
MEEMNNSRKRKVEIDYNALFDADDDPPQIERLPTITDQSRDDILSLSDHDLNQRILRQKDHCKRLGPSLPDKGLKLATILKLLQQEQLRRTHLTKDADPFSNRTQLTSSRTTDGCRRENAFSEANSRSDFASRFTKTIEENKGHGVDNAYDKELSMLGRQRGAMFQKGRKKDLLSSSRRSSFQCATSLSQSGGKQGTSDGGLNGRLGSTSFHRNGESLSNNLLKKKDNCQALHSNGSRPRKGQTIDLSDEDEDEEDTQFVKTERENRIGQRMKDKKICYPSRDDPELVEICYSDIQCLDPEVFLTSEIMNFYIRYLRLQVSPEDKSLCDYHFFNTFFYKKLKQAVSNKGSDKESFFIKFRRWWKGVNIFQKAYIFIPIHEDLHWSLVIICIPDKEDKSGPIILHLDSLGFHSSKTVFEEIRSFLKQEWNYLHGDVSPLDLPIADHIWQNLPRRIDEKKIEVPQQKNDSDCGLFVLFFMERFIEDSPERLKKIDLAMFGKRWFKPEEASGLRKKIRELVLNEFEKASYVSSSSESPSPSLNSSPP